MRETIVLILWIYLAYSKASPSSSFEFPSLELYNLTLLGDAHMKNGSVSLSRDLPVPTTSVGRALYNQPIRFLDPATKIAFSFNTCFIFSVTNVDPSSIGSGMAFLITPNAHNVGASGGYMGVITPPSSDGSSVTFREVSGNTIAVEFDTFMDVEFHDPNGNHVGVDIDNMTSLAVADLDTVDMDMKAGNLITAWIEYDSPKQSLKVSLSYTNQKPEQAVLDVGIDLSKFLSEFMYVGFSAATAGSTELHNIMGWGFYSDAAPTASNDSNSSSSNGRSSSNGGSSSSSSGIPANAPFFQPDSVDNKSPASPVLGRKAKCHNGNCHKEQLIAGIAAGGALTFALVTASVTWICLRNRRLKKSSSFHYDIVKLPRKFSYKELSVATKGFNSARIVGHGAFGTVYKGVIPDTGALVAVKRSTCNEQGKNEFMAELSIIGSLRHKNLVQLQGWCHEKGEILLVYDYMMNSSLDKALFNEFGGSVLSWENRCKIVAGVASALAYLHEEWEKQVVHRDVKASNIMLDGEFNARLGDFGLARLIDHNKSPDATLTAGTMGYLAPEYLLSGKASVKTDVFSFGAVILEVSCGRRPIEKGVQSGQSNLVDWVWTLYRDGRLLEAADNRLNGNFPEGETRKMLLVGLLCSHPDPANRPSMRQVLQILNGEAPLPPVPRHKPSLSLPSNLLLNLQDIVSDCSQSQISSETASFRDHA